MPPIFDQALKTSTSRPGLSPARPTGALTTAVSLGVSSAALGAEPPLSAPLPVIDRASAPRARGFAAMDKDRQRQIASAGGRAAHECGNAHEFTSEEARSAGRKGGMSISQNREHMASIGSKGGLTRGERQRGRQASTTV